MQQALLVSLPPHPPSHVVALGFQDRHELELAGSCNGQHDGAAEESRGHLHLGQENAENDDVQGDPEDVVDGRALALRDYFALESAHCREVHADATLENQKAHENQVVARRDYRDEKAQRGDYEGVLGDFFYWHRFREDGEEGASGHARHHEGSEDQAKWEGLVFSGGGLKGGGPHEDEREHASFE